MKPFFYLLAGANGVGKSAIASLYLPNGLELVSADDIAGQLQREQTHLEVARQLAHDEAQQRIQRHLRRRTSFAVETTLHDIETWQYYLAIQQAGYEFRLLFLGVDELNMLYQRVRNRQAQGGQFVNEETIRRKYVAGLSVLAHFFDEPDSITLLDMANRPALSYQRVDGQVRSQASALPDWITTNLSRHVGAASADATPTVDRSSFDRGSA